HAPLGGIDAGGWKLVYTDKPSDMLDGYQGDRKFPQVSFSLGFTVTGEGDISDVIPVSPAAKTGEPPSMKLVAVKRRKRSTDILRSAIKAAKTDPGQIELLLENADFYKTVKLDYHGGERYPDLQRDETKPDMLAEILKPLTAR